MKDKFKEKLAWCAKKTLKRSIVDRSVRLDKKRKAIPSRTRILEYLDISPMDFFTLHNKMKSTTAADKLGFELEGLLRGGYIARLEIIYVLTDRGREYMKVERARSSKELKEQKEII
jgi:hypothetical protein